MDVGWVDGWVDGHVDEWIIGDTYTKRLSTDKRYIKLHDSFITNTFSFKYNSCYHCRSRA